MLFYQGLQSMGTFGIRCNHLLAATFTLFKPWGTDFARHIEMSQPTFKPFRRACGEQEGWPNKWLGIFRIFGGTFRIHFLLCRPIQSFILQIISHFFHKILSFSYILKEFWFESIRILRKHICRLFGAPPFYVNTENMQKIGIF